MKNILKCDIRPERTCECVRTGPTVFAKVNSEPLHSLNSYRVWTRVHAHRSECILSANGLINSLFENLRKRHNWYTIGDIVQIKLYNTAPQWHTVCVCDGNLYLLDLSVAKRMNQAGFRIPNISWESLGSGPPATWHLTYLILIVLSSYVTSGRSCLCLVSEMPRLPFFLPNACFYAVEQLFSLRRQAMSSF